MITIGRSASLRAVSSVSQEALKYFGSHGGSVINISSIASLNPTPDSVVYAATKSAVDSITRGLAKELGARKIRVNAIAPGGTASDGLARPASWGAISKSRLSA
jgi:3-oxoacyl-[acyl-carrier protein] reductase